MKITPIICPQCNAQIKIDADQRTGVCEYCGTKFILEGDKVKVQKNKEKSGKKEHKSTDNSEKGTEKKANKTWLILLCAIAVLNLAHLVVNYTGSGSKPVSITTSAATEKTAIETEIDTESVTEQNITTESNEKSTESKDYALADAVSAPGTVIGEPVADLEIIRAGYTVSNGYLYYAVAIRNNSDDNAVITPAFRYTAMADNGAILGTDTQYLNSIYPGQDCVWAFMGFSISEMPETVKFDIIEPDQYNIMPAEMMTHPEFQPYEVKNISEKSDPVLGTTINGEVYNPNDYTMDEVAVSVVYMDSEGVIQGGDTTFVDGLSSHSSVPFSITPMCPESDRYKVFASSWSF